MKQVELYRFTQDANVWTFTSASKVQTYASETYTPIPIGRNIIEGRGELSKANIEVTVSILNVTARSWMNVTSESILNLVIYQQSVLGTYAIWQGRMASITPQESDIKFVFESIFTSMRRPGLRARYQRICRHALYQARCGLNKDDFAVVRSATLGSGSVITIPSISTDPANDYFTGMLKAPDGTYRMIVSQSSTTVTLSRPIISLLAALGAGPTDVTLYPGCDRSRERCVARFNNINRNGSFPFMPPRNPFDGSSIV